MLTVVSECTGIPMSVLQANPWTGQNRLPCLKHYLHQHHAVDVQPVVSALVVVPKPPPDMVRLCADVDLL